MAKAPTTKTASAEGSTTPAPVPATAATGTAWGTTPAPAPAPAPEAALGNGGGSTTPAPTGESTTTAQTTETQPAANVESRDADAGQGRVETPSDNVTTADAPTGAAAQANPNTSAHHDVSTEGSGPGGTAPNAEVAERTGAPIADGKNGDAIPGYNPDAEYDDNGVEKDAPTLHITDEQPSIGDMLAVAAKIDVKVAQDRANAKPKTAAPSDLPEQLTGEIEFAPGPNEKRSDAFGSTHDASGKPVVGSRDNDPDGTGRPVYVGTAQPVADPAAAWRSNA